MTRNMLMMIFIFLLCSCQKGEDELFDYTITGITNLQSNVGETKVVDISVVKTKGAAEEVVLSLKNIPKGVSYVFSTYQGATDFNTQLTLTITSEAALGNYSIVIEAVSATTRKSFPCDLLIDDQLSLSISVYDVTKWSSEQPWGVFSDSALIRLYLSEADFLNGKAAYSEKTNNDGKALFYRMIPGNYLFVVEKNELSNIVSKKMITGQECGFVTVGIFKTKTEVYNSSQPSAQPGDLKYRDQNGDGKITDVDRRCYDELSVYEKVLNEKVIWIGI